MRANVSLIAPNLSDAREKAKQAFKDFYREKPFEIVEESAESHTAVESRGGDGFQVVSWRCDFTAEELTRQERKAAL